MGNKEGRSFQIVSKEPEVVGGLHLKLPSPTTRVDLTSKASPLLQFSLGRLVDLRLSTRTSTKHELPSKLDSRVPVRAFSLPLHFLGYSTTKKEEKLVRFFAKRRDAKVHSV